MRKLIFILFLAVFSSGFCLGQDIHFSQFYESSVWRNPALTGVFSGDYKIAINYRNQWSSFAVPYQTTLATAESRILLKEETNDFLSFGFTSIYDRAGSIDFTSLSAYGAVNYNKCLGGQLPTYLNLGFSAGFLQRSFDVSKMRVANQFNGIGYNGGAASGETMDFGAIRHWDLSAGLSLSGALSSRANYYLGAAAYHVTRPSESFSGEQLIRLNTRWTANAGLNTRLGDLSGLSVHVNYQQQQPYQELIGGMTVSRRFAHEQAEKSLVLHAGCYYRFGDAIIPTFRADYKNWAVTMTYDVTVGSHRMDLTGFGGSEVSVAFRGIYPNKQRHSLKCPQFEMLEMEVEW